MPTVGAAAVHAIRVMNNENSWAPRRAPLIVKGAPRSCHSFMVIKVTSVDASEGFALHPACRMIRFPSLHLSLPSSLTPLLYASGQVSLKQHIKGVPWLEGHLAQIFMCCSELAEKQDLTP